jgi:hypothetical protein
VPRILRIIVKSVHNMVPGSCIFLEKLVGLVVGSLKELLKVKERSWAKLRLKKRFGYLNYVIID